MSATAARVDEQGIPRRGNQAHRPCPPSKPAPPAISSKAAHPSSWQRRCGAHPRCPCRRQLAHEPATHTRHQPTRREIEVLTLVADGVPGRAITDRLHLTEGTVKSHLAGCRSGSGRDVEDSVGATFAVDHDVVDEGIVAGFGQGEFHEAALGG